MAVQVLNRSRRRLIIEHATDNRTRTALHAPTSKNWTLQINYPFNSSARGGTTHNYILLRPSVHD